ncbi:MAG TPA: Ig-like domain-containing protein [Gemmatimonadaceae bacterium]|nr:Ig-like domain-containing protein [Gemmatimonadaceae bacterium]
MLIPSAVGGTLGYADTSAYGVWTSSDSTIASVTGVSSGVGFRADEGYVRGMRSGRVTITVTVHAVPGASTVTKNTVLTVYAPVVRRVAFVSPPDTVLTERRVSLLARVFDQMGEEPVMHGPIEWTSSDPAVATIDGDGGLAGVAPGTTVISATVDGATASAPVTVVLGQPSPSLEGMWTMTVSVSPECRDRMPDYARMRQYRVHFTQVGAEFTLTVDAGASRLFTLNDGGNAGHLTGKEIWFQLAGDTNYGSYASWDIYDYLEHVNEYEAINFGGDVTGTVADSGTAIHAVMRGEINYLNGTEVAYAPPAVTCRASDHALTFARMP